MQQLTTLLRLTQNDLKRGLLDSTLAAPEVYMNIGRVSGADVVGFGDQDMSFYWLDSMFGN